MRMSGVDEKTVKGMRKRKIREADLIGTAFCTGQSIELFAYVPSSWAFIPHRWGHLFVSFPSYLWKLSLNCVRGVTCNEYLNGHEIGFLLLDPSKTVFFR